MTLHTLLGWFLLCLLVIQLILLFILEFKINHFLNEIKDVVQINNKTQPPPEGMFKFSQKVIWIRENLAVIPNLFKVRVKSLLMFHLGLRLLTVTFFLLCILFGLTQK